MRERLQFLTSADADDDDPMDEDVEGDDRRAAGYDINKNKVTQI